MVVKAARVIAMLAAAGLACGLVVVRPPSAAEASSGFAFNWTGRPATPQPWMPGAVNDWDLMVHDTFVLTGRGFPDGVGQHGADCSPSPATHPISRIDDAVFICNNHVMTMTNTGGFAATVMTPAQMADWSSGTVRIQFRVSTLRTTNRDWIGITVTPFAENLAIPIESDQSGEGMPRNALACTVSDGPPSKWSCSQRTNFNEQSLPSGGPSVEDTLRAAGQSPSAVARTLFEMDISRTHLRFGMPEYNNWFVNADLPSPLAYSQGVVQFGEQAYDTGKECSAGSQPNMTCVNNTWHWSDFSISDAVPFTMIRPAGLGSGPIGGGASTPTIDLPTASPPNSFLRFAAAGDVINYSLDRGRTWARAVEQPASKMHQTANKNYFVPIPAGVTSVTFSGKDYGGGPWLVQDPSVWSSNQTSQVPINKAPPVGSQPATGPAAPTIDGDRDSRIRIRTAPASSPQVHTSALGLAQHAVANVITGAQRSPWLAAGGGGLALGLLLGILVRSRFGALRGPRKKS